MTESTHKRRHTVKVTRSSLTKKYRPQKASPMYDPRQAPNADLRQVVDHAAPHARIAIAEQKGTITLTGTAKTLGQKNSAGFACWALASTVAVYNDVKVAKTESAMDAAKIS